MGCDIHFVVERKYNNGWVGVHSTGNEATPAGQTIVNGKIEKIGYVYSNIKQRDYDFFALLAGVRGPGPSPLGVPDDSSSLTHMVVDYWGNDGHSHSHASLQDFCTKKAIAQAEGGVAEVMRRKMAEGNTFEYVEEYFPHMSQEQVKDFRVVYWFDN